jgi:transcriptional regulator of arginine metabolism
VSARARPVVQSPAERRARIRALLRGAHIGTQEELRAALLADRIEVTQATLSRDLRALRARRVTRTDGTIVYETPEAEAEGAAGHGALVALVGAAVTAIDRSDSLVIVRTQPGAASAIARAIDLGRLDGVVGTLAGDDTIFVAPRHRRLLPQIERRLGSLFSHAKEPS